MSPDGISLCARYAYPPNFLSLCGPENKKGDLRHYSSKLERDKGLPEILIKFNTLYPYLMLIAGENNIKDPFDKRIVEAYWLGNKLLNKIPVTEFYKHMTNSLFLKNKMKISDTEKVFDKLAMGALPHHSFHVLNIYLRTGNIEIPQTVETMDACLINAGKVERITKYFFIVKTKPLRIIDRKLKFGQTIRRKIIPQGDLDLLFPEVKLNDWVAYHWGQFCTKLTDSQLRNLTKYTTLSINLANTNLSIL